VFFDADYREVAILRDGTPVVLRLVRPDDKERFRRGFERMSPHSRYLRFFTPKPALTDEELRYLTEVDQVRHLAIGASTLDGVDGLGVARLIQLDGEPGASEAAIAVVDDMHGKGLGSLLFMRLVAAARERGVERVRCEVLGSNSSMQQFLQGALPERTVKVDSGVVTVEMQLPGVDPAQPAAEPPRESGMYELLRMAARGLVKTRAVVARLMGGGDDTLDGPTDDTGG
jgi:GNAT superfamily N-acetyltransferase